MWLSSKFLLRANSPSRPLGRLKPAGSHNYASRWLASVRQCARAWADRFRSNAWVAARVHAAGHRWMRQSHGPLSVRDWKWHELGDDRCHQLGLDQRRRVGRKQRRSQRGHGHWRWLRDSRWRKHGHVERSGHKLFALRRQSLHGHGLVREPDYAYLAEQLFGWQSRDGLRGPVSRGSLANESSDRRRPPPLVRTSASGRQLGGDPRDNS
jgi:hypothetical protein